MTEQAEKPKEENISRVTGIVRGIFKKLYDKNTNISNEDMNNNNKDNNEKFTYVKHLLNLKSKVAKIIGKNPVSKECDLIAIPKKDKNHECFIPLTAPKEEIEKIQILEIKRKCLNNDFRKSNEKKNESNYLNTYNGSIKLLETKKRALLEKQIKINIKDYIELHYLNDNQIETYYDSDGILMNLNTGSTYIIIFELKNNNKSKVIQPLYSKSEKQIYRRNCEKNNSADKNNSGTLIENFIDEGFYGMAICYLDSFFNSIETIIDDKKVSLSFFELEVYNIDISTEVNELSRKLGDNNGSKLKVSEIIDCLIQIMNKMKEQEDQRKNLSKRIKIEPSENNETKGDCVINDGETEKRKRKLECIDSQGNKSKKLNNNNENNKNNEEMDVDLTLSDIGEIPEIVEKLSRTLSSKEVKEVNQRCLSEMKKLTDNENKSSLKIKDSNQYGEMTPKSPGLTEVQNNSVLSQSNMNEVYNPLQFAQCVAQQSPNHTVNQLNIVENYCRQADLGQLLEVQEYLQQAQVQVQSAIQNVIHNAIQNVIQQGSPQVQVSSVQTVNLSQESLIVDPIISSLIGTM